MKNVLLLVVSLTTLGIAASYYVSRDSQYQSQLSTLQKDIDFTRNRLKASHDLRLLEFNNQFSHVNYSVLYKEISGGLSKTSDICATGNKLVFSIPESVCNTCHESTFKQLNSISNIINTKNVIVLVDNSKLRSTYVEFEERKSEMKVLGVDFKSLGFDIHYVPFFFILSSDSSIENLFIPNSFDPKLTNDYIKIIKNKHFQ